MVGYENPYPGVNAHLNSLLQTPGTFDQPAVWRSFHSRHIAHIADALNEQLPPRYVAFTEQSLQTHELSIVGAPGLDSPRPDVSIFQTHGAGGHATAALTPTWEATIAELNDPVDEPFAVIIREVLDQQTLGRVVTRIELL
ncbi:MAG: DUF4058 family protein, partial [Anaerolineae bacterium]|nr:DUF4058 family protein [Anaerolineae bacterium]